MNTAISPQVLNTKFARYIENMLPSSATAGALAKRFGTATLGDVITGEDIERLMWYVKSDGTLQILAYTDAGAIKTLNEGTGAWTNVKTGLTTTGVVRWCHFNGKLIICNGVDLCMSWDGTTMTDLAEWVEDAAASNYTQSSTSVITIDPGTRGGAGGNADYPDGRNIRVTFDTAGAVEAVISSTSYADPTLTITATGTPFPSPSETITKVEYEDNPPAFSFIYPQHDRLWALAPKQLKASDWDAAEADRMDVFFTDISNSENAWFDATTQEVGFLNLLDKHAVADQLEGISAIDGNLIFLGRNKLQIWAGVDPTALGDLSWVKTIPVGCIHGDLIQEFPRDVLFMTRYGARSVRTVFQTEGIEASPDIGTNIDPTVQADVDTLVSSDANYKLARSFFYERDGFFGFRIGSKPLIYVLTEESKGWVVFSGTFEDLGDSLSLPDGRLIVAKGTQLYTYDNGADGGTPTYGDDGTAIRTAWWTPWITPGGTWSNRYFQLLIEPGSAAIDAILRRSKDNNSAQVKDLTIEVNTSQPTWGEAQWGTSTWGAREAQAEERDKFIAYSFALRLETNTTTGGIEVVGIKSLGT